MAVIKEPYVHEYPYVCDDDSDYVLVDPGHDLMVVQESPNHINDDIIPDDQTLDHHNHHHNAISEAQRSISHGSSSESQENIRIKTPPQKPSDDLKTPTKMGKLFRLAMIFLMVFTLNDSDLPFFDFFFPVTTPSFRIESFSTSFFHISSTNKLSASWAIGFSAVNPRNSTTFLYDNLKASVYYGDKLVALTMVEPFNNGQDSKMSFRATFPKSEVMLAGLEAKALRGDQTTDWPSLFNVKMTGRIRPDLGKSSELERSYELSVLCPDVYATVGDWWRFGRMTGGANECEVSLHGAMKRKVGSKRWSKQRGDSGMRYMRQWRLPDKSTLPIRLITSVSYFLSPLFVARYLASKRK